ncbi:hypothetical protein RvY_02985 [Ramazzottius varieornatus]|uniref:ATP synthase subunit g n=1 Tax=Ramazzottius varieornatus TaxID=947166 RepID=A0A1D1ULI7_RAMVA|nr:hypothetical protein RvY_02985 [Ramazzottius varieornatus]
MARMFARIPAMAQEAMVAARPGLNTAWKYAKSELRPPTPAEIPKGIAGLMSIATRWGRQPWRHLTVKEAWLNTLVTVEVMCWFFVGEVVGRRHLLGYKPGYGYKGH